MCHLERSWLEWLPNSTDTVMERVKNMPNVHKMHLKSVDWSRCSVFSRTSKSLKRCFIGVYIDTNVIYQGFFQNWWVDHSESQICDSHILLAENLKTELYIPFCFSIFDLFTRYLLFISCIFLYIFSDKNQQNLSKQWIMTSQFIIEKTSQKWRHKNNIAYMETGVYRISL